METELKDMIPIEPTGEIPVKVPEPDKTVIPEKSVVESKEFEVKSSKKWFEQDGFKRSVGGALMCMGGILTMIPSTNLLGQGLFYGGSAIYGVGVLDAAKKSTPNHNGEKGMLFTIVEGLKKLAEKIGKK